MHHLVLELHLDSLLRLQLLLQLLSLSPVLEGPKTDEPPRKASPLPCTRCFQQVFPQQRVFGSLLDRKSHGIRPNKVGWEEPNSRNTSVRPWDKGTRWGSLPGLLQL